MQAQSLFKVTWTPHDHRMIVRLTSESLQTQQSAHGSSHDQQHQRVVARPFLELGVIA